MSNDKKSVWGVDVFGVFEPDKYNGRAINRYMNVIAGDIHEAIYKVKKNTLTLKSLM